MEEIARERQKRLAVLRGEIPLDESIINSDKDKEDSKVEPCQSEPNTLEAQAKKLLDEARFLGEKLNESSLGLEDLAPKRANWDLKRDFEKKTSGLEEQTVNAITEIVRMRLQQQQQ